MCFSLPGTGVKKDMEFTAGFMVEEEEEEELKRQHDLLMDSCPSFGLLSVEQNSWSSLFVLLCHLSFFLSFFF